MTPDPYRHYDRYAEQYDKISRNLDAIWASFQEADRFNQKVMLFDSTVYAVMSVQNSVEILRKGFREYANCETWSDLNKVMHGFNYGNSKYEYIRENFEVVFGSTGDEIIETLLSDIWAGVETIVDNLAGLSWIKGAFVPAMLGNKKVMCIDTNVEQMSDKECVNSKGYTDGSEYKEAIEAIKSEYPRLAGEVSTFMFQWILFDANRGTGVTLHEEWFEYMLPGTPFGRQLSLSDF